MIRKITNRHVDKCIMIRKIAIRHADKHNQPRGQTIYQIN
jgi:hypothetical protein